MCCTSTQDSMYKSCTTDVLNRNSRVSKMFGEDAARVWLLHDDCNPLPDDRGATYVTPLLVPAKITQLPIQTALHTYTLHFITLPQFINLPTQTSLHKPNKSPLSNSHFTPTNTSTFYGRMCMYSMYWNFPGLMLVYVHRTVFEMQHLNSHWTTLIHQYLLLGW